MSYQNIVATRTRTSRKMEKMIRLTKYPHHADKLVYSRHLRQWPILSANRDPRETPKNQKPPHAMAETYRIMLGHPVALKRCHLLTFSLAKTLRTLRKQNRAKNKEDEMLYLEVLGKLAETAVEPVLARHEQLDVVQLGEVQLQQVEEIGLLRNEIRENASSARKHTIRAPMVDSNGQVLPH